MNATTRDLARMAASVARDSIARAPQVDLKGAPRRPNSRVRAGLHVAVTIGLAIALFALAVKWSEERHLRRQAEAQVRGMVLARAPTIAIEQQHAAQASRAALAARLSPAANSATNLAIVTTAGAPSTVRDRDFQQQLRHQLSDPALRSALRGQQRSAVLQLYGDLLRSWHLSADKSDRVLDLLAEQQLQEMEQSLNAADPKSKSAARASTEAAAPANNDELNAMLNDQQRKELQRQQDALGERLTVGSLADELSLAQMPLTDTQREQLTQVMVDERKAVPVPDVSSLPDDSREARRALEDWQSALDQRVQDRAAPILTSAQQTRYEQFMSRQREARNVFAAFEVAQGADNAGGAGIPDMPVAAVPSQP
jgi:hypothetical protein